MVEKIYYGSKNLIWFKRYMVLKKWMKRFNMVQRIK